MLRESKIEAEIENWKLIFVYLSNKRIFKLAA